VRTLVLVAALSSCVAAPLPDAGAGGEEGGEGEAAGDCGDDDPLTNEGWAGFCEDRVDDNCTKDVDEECPEITSSTVAGQHHLGCTSDEPCPQTAPGAAAPDWDCTGTAPENVVAFARFTEANEQVASFCAFVYESPVVGGEYFATVTLVNGTDPQGPEDPSIGSGGLCSADFSARRYLFFSDVDGAACEAVRFIHAYGFESDTGFDHPVDEQKLSNRCRKAIRLVTRNDPAFEPDVQFFAASEDEMRAKLDVLETAEIGCVGIDNLSGAPYRTTEVFVVQADAPLTYVPR
jgi:hypothetical protein